MIGCGACKGGTYSRAPDQQGQTMTYYPYWTPAIFATTLAFGASAVAADEG